MNTELSTTENASATDSQEQVRPARSGTGLALICLFVALASLAASGWLWWRGTSAEQGATDRIAADLKSQAMQLAEAESRSTALELKVSALLAANQEPRLLELEQDVGSLRQSNSTRQALEDDAEVRLRAIKTSLESVQARLAAAENRLTSMSARTVDSSAELDVAEVDYLLRLAQERLILFADVPSAVRALEIAGRHLAAFDNPMFLGVAQEIAAARQRLSLVQHLDYLALEQKLELLQAGISTLAFKGDGVVSERQEPTADKGLWARIRNAFSGLVTVRRTTADESELPVLADRELIRQRMWLQLEVARWAALRSEQDAYAAALNRFSESLDRWFEPAGEEVQSNLRDALTQNVNPTLPDISAPWTALRAIQGIGLSGPSRNEPDTPKKGITESPLPPEPAGDPEDEDAMTGDASQ